ncbi:MAG: hypothetical protein RI897_1918 [Verrucomicrobiota bacterium]|jgi:hypothetical protein
MEVLLFLMAPRVNIQVRSGVFRVLARVRCWRVCGGVVSLRVMGVDV